MIALPTWSTPLAWPNWRWPFRFGRLKKTAGWSFLTSGGWDFPTDAKKTSHTVTELLKYNYNKFLNNEIDFLNINIEMKNTLELSDQQNLELNNGPVIAPLLLTLYQRNTDFTQPITSWNHETKVQNTMILFFQKLNWLNNAGLGPINFISPLKILYNCGISSKLYFLKNGPIPV